MLTIDKNTVIIYVLDGPLVKRLRRSPLKAESWVRFPYGSPNNKIETHKNSYEDEDYFYVF